MMASMQSRTCILCSEVFDYQNRLNENMHDSKAMDGHTVKHQPNEVQHLSRIHTRYT